MFDYDYRNNEIKRAEAVFMTLLLSGSAFILLIAMVFGLPLYVTGIALFRALFRAGQRFIRNVRVEVRNAFIKTPTEFRLYLITIKTLWMTRDARFLRQSLALNEEVVRRYNLTNREIMEIVLSRQVTKANHLFGRECMGMPVEGGTFREHLSLNPDIPLKDVAEHHNKVPEHHNKYVS